jgi:hypothetical protein
MPSTFRYASLETKARARAFLLLLAGLPLSLPLARSVVASEMREPETPERCAAIQVLSPQSKHPGRNARFSATEILDLEFRVLLARPLSGDHRLDLRVYSPDGQLYQTLTVPFHTLERGGAASTGGRARRGKRKLSDYPQPIEEAEVSSRAKERTGHGAVRANLPVAGTSIVASSLYGRWKAEAFLDSGLAACGAPARFVITE